MEHQHTTGSKKISEPFNSKLKPQLIARETFVLAETAPDRRLFQSGDLFVLACKAASSLSGP